MISTDRIERIKEREGSRLVVSLRRLFAKPFGFHWTNKDTSFYDGKDIWVKYDLQTGNHREFTDVELRALRHGHGVHEAGHSEFDYLQAYIDWQKEMNATCNKDWKENLKYPLSWLQFFGNMALDGRMERLIVLKSPNQQPYLDLNNYDWRFGHREKGMGEDLVNDFRSCYAHRVLGMTDLSLWQEEAVALVDSVQHLVEEIRTAPTTALCLAHVTALIQEVWPTLLEWMDIDLDDLDEEEDPFKNDEQSSDMTSGQWADSEEEAMSRSVEILERVTSTEDSSDDPTEEEGAATPSEPSQEEQEEKRKEEVKQMLDKLAKIIVKEAKEVEQELIDSADYRMRATFSGNDGKEVSATVELTDYPEPSLQQYKDSFQHVRRYVKPVAKQLESLLEGEPEQVRRNVRSGRFMPNQAWRAIHCDDSNVFQKHNPGVPKKDAFIGCMTDISGSTYTRLQTGNTIVEEMRRSLTLLLEASHSIHLPSEAYAFTEKEVDYTKEYYTHIFRLKPKATLFTESNRAAIGGITHSEGNRDTVALNFLLEQVRKRSEGIRLAIMLSDGEPIFERNEGPETIEKMVKQAEKEGIDVLCLFIGNHSEYTVERVKSMYPGRVIFAQKGIASELQKHVKRIIRSRR
ncbi:hypothetical protein MHH81_20940 [Psychrobacillus sp. FSL H8-0484]|uniref:hypothetical protein n=1 Tax=Psychrobacillus sp. FSL H8-0484 TaxID=2921390 RepID=UPI0030F789D7